MTSLAMTFAAGFIAAELNFPASPDFARSGRTLALKTTVVQTSKDAFVIDAADFAKFQPANAKGRLVAAEGSLSSANVRWASDLEYLFTTIERGRYDVWEHVKFPLKGKFCHRESLDGGIDRAIIDAADPMVPESYLPPHVWHWVRTWTTWPLQNCTHRWRFLPPGAWGGGAELDRIVFIRSGSKLKPEEVDAKARKVMRAAKAELVAKRIKLTRVGRWRLDAEFDAGDGRVVFEYSADCENWRAVPLGKIVTPAAGEEFLYVRCRFEAAADGGRQPIVYDYRFEIERKTPEGMRDEGRGMRDEGMRDEGRRMMEAGIAPLRIVPNKIVYDEGETGWFDAVLTNRGDSAAKAEAVVTEAWGLGLKGESRELWRGEVALEAGSGRTLKIAYPGSTARYGHEVRLTLNPNTPTPKHPLNLSTSQPPNLSTSRAEYFNVNTDWWRVNQGMTLSVSTRKGGFTPQLLRMIDYYGYTTNDWKAPKSPWFESTHWEAHLPGLGPFLCYDNLQTRWQIQKSSIGGNAKVFDYPDEKIWGNLQNRPYSTGEIRRDTAATKARGLHHTHYTIPFAESGFGFEVARKNPEYFRRDAGGRYAGLFASGRYKCNPVVTSDPESLLQTPWIYCEPNLFRRDATEWALDDLVAALKGIGEDGVYFDGRYMQHSGWDAFGNDLRKQPACDEAIVRNMKLSLEKIFKWNPKAYVWSNGGSPENPEMALADHPQTGLLKETQWQFILNPQRPDHSYRGLLGGIRNVRDVVYRGGKYVRHPSKILHVGYLCTTYNAEDALRFKESWVMASHVMALLAAVTAHPFAGSLPMRPYKQLMTRYSEFFWHEDLEIVDEPEKEFELDSLREIWWKDGVYRRETKDFVQYSISLVNSPESEFCDESVIVDPPAADDVEIALKGAKRARAWVMTPYGREGGMEPKIVELEVKDGTVAVPEFTYYTLLVIRVQK